MLHGFRAVHCSSTLSSRFTIKSPACSDRFMQFHSRGLSAFILFLHLPLLPLATTAWLYLIHNAAYFGTHHAICFTRNSKQQRAVPTFLLGFSGRRPAGERGEDYRFFMCFGLKTMDSTLTADLHLGFAIAIQRDYQIQLDLYSVLSWNSFPLTTLG